MTPVTSYGRLERWYMEGFDALHDGQRPRWRSTFAWWAMQLRDKRPNL